MQIILVRCDDTMIQLANPFQVNGAKHETVDSTLYTKPALKCKLYDFLSTKHKLGVPLIHSHTMVLLEENLIPMGS